MVEHGMAARSPLAQTRKFTGYGTNGALVEIIKLKKQLANFGLLWLGEVRRNAVVDVHFGIFGVQHFYRTSLSVLDTGRNLDQVLLGGKADSGLHGHFEAIPFNGAAIEVKIQLAPGSNHG
ncbi:hypothetical protein GN958_ATG17471 [Phytophthora infestans]|uniref:Uncharacterized protein n=1 Tax=Phytophthora infestans TaxID=4787 RepID=A0A8S9TY02_PHYIN|nr:hypothetical protein GN958_ATG17471 [Phytophthora infestans]